MVFEYQFRNCTNISTKERALEIELQEQAIVSGGDTFRRYGQIGIDRNKYLRVLHFPLDDEYDEYRCLNRVTLLQQLPNTHAIPLSSLAGATYV
jgi:hypothetical protein